MPDTDKLDRRLHAYRYDLAEISLKGRVEAERFAEGEPYHVTATIAPLHPTPSHDADLDTQALCGEAVRVFDIEGGWAWCQLRSDRYVGYVPVDLIAQGAPAKATHRILSPHVLVYAQPDAASKPLNNLLLYSPLTAIGDSDDFIVLAEGGYVGKRHVEPITATEPDFVATALKMRGAPYLWGGKSVLGIDCSGLVQLSLLRAGVACPRDTDMQQRELPGDLEIGDDVLQRLQRGDIVYWPRHVGIMLDDTNVLHASGTLMTTDIEPIQDVAERSRKDGPIFSAVKRLMN